MKKIFKYFLFAVILFIALLGGYFFVGSAEPAEEIAWGVNFSQKHAENFHLDWQKAYLAILDDLGVQNIKIITNWDLLEPEPVKYNFDDLDWQLEKAKERQAKVLLVVGIKTGHWPECHIPEWAGGLGKEEQQTRTLKLLEEIVIKYRGATPVWAWQVENEALFPFGECPWRDKAFLKKEIELVKSLDSKRPVIISDSGEFSFWIAAAKLGDIVSTTLHRKVWFKEIKNYVAYPLRPVFYWRKSQIIKKLFNKEVIVGELQAEPWCPQYLPYDCAMEEQRKTMDLRQFQKNIEFVRQTGLKDVYLWGAEWWYWMKEIQNDSRIWNEAKTLFQG